MDAGQYFRLRPEGIEDDMTFNGEPADSNAIGNRSMRNVFAVMFSKQRTLTIFIGTFLALHVMSLGSILHRS